MASLALDKLTRRALLRRAGQLAFSSAALPMAMDLAAIGEAAAFEAGDYKALVCVFLQGGNDHDNTVVPYDATSHGRYSSIRGTIALTRDALASTLLQPDTALPGGRQYALHPNGTGLAALFNSGRAAVLLNVGPLVVPTTRTQYTSGNRKTNPLPPKLFSHNDQQSIWQSQSPEGSAIGWGGRIGDLALAGNGQSLFTCISSAGAAVFVSGQSALQYQLSLDGAIAIQPLKHAVYGSSAVSQALATLTTQSRQGMLETEYNKITARSVQAESAVTAAIGSVNLKTSFPNTTLARQLKTVARLIGARASLGVKRQVFLVQIGGFDNHGGLMAQHPSLITTVSAAMNAFYNATVELGLGSQVTAFTASDFGRTLAINGSGTDHGWGSHHLIVGGAVRGKAFYGTAPPVSIGNTAAAEDQWHVGQGRLLPTTSVDQYAATLARWFGVADSELDAILPNLRHFDVSAAGIAYPRTLGFL